VLVGVLLLHAGCSSDEVDTSTTWWEDPCCNAGRVPPPPPREFTAYVGLFRADGAPLCIEDAEVVVFQRGAREARPKRFRVHETGVAGRRASDLSMGVVDGAIEPFAPPCNLYLAESDADRAFDDGYWPVEYSVRAEGCEVAAGTFTWNDNWYPWKTVEQRHWSIPVVLDCPGRAPDGSRVEADPESE
jgi:hypothetical protein